jgi:hypothetical protein
MSLDFASDNLSVGMSLQAAMGTSNFTVEAGTGRSGLDLANMQRGLGIAPQGVAQNFNASVTKPDPGPQAAAPQPAPRAPQPSAPQAALN